MCVHRNSPQCLAFEISLSHPQDAKSSEQNQTDGDEIYRGQLKYHRVHYNLLPDSDMFCNK